MSVKTGYLYDELMLLHCNDDKSNGTEPENPARCSVPHAMLTSSGSLKGVVHINGRYATVEELKLVHTAEHISEVQSYSSSNPYPHMVIKEISRPTYVCDHTYNCACLATGSVLSLADSVCTKQVLNGVALVRPPGHHAEVNQSGGFCIFNTLAVTTKYIQQKYQDFKKIAIIDWDVHHGNGIQHMFYDDHSVLYVSLHRYDNGDFYPHLPESSYDSVGEGKGRGFNVNIAWNYSKMGNNDYAAAFQHIVLPILTQFGPDLVLVACGFDAAEGDSLGEYTLTPDMYAWMTKELQKIAKNKIILVLEGGYQPEVIGTCLMRILSVLCNGGESDGDLTVLPSDRPCQDARDTIYAVKRIHAQYWTL